MQAMRVGSDGDHTTAFDLLARCVGAGPKPAALSYNLEVSIFYLSKVFDLLAI